MPSRLRNPRHRYILGGEYLPVHFCLDVNLFPLGLMRHFPINNPKQQTYSAAVPFGKRIAYKWAVLSCAAGRPWAPHRKTRSMALVQSYYNTASLGVYSNLRASSSASSSSRATAGQGFDTLMQKALGSTSATQKIISNSPLVMASSISTSGVDAFNPLELPSSWQSTVSKSSALNSSLGSTYSYKPNNAATGTNKITALGTADAVALSDSISSFNGDYFSDGITLSEWEAVGDNIDQFHFTHIVEKDGLYYGYFIDHTGGSQNDVGLATSTDGVNFDYKGKVLTKGPEEYDALEASFPSVQYDEDTETWYMLYEAKASYDDVNSVCLATSKDGYNWTKQGPIINPGDAGDISAVDVGTPTMFKEDGQWNVYFHTLANDGRVRIGYATGDDLTNLAVSEGALLDTDPGGIEAGTVGARSNVIKAGDYYYMAYEVCTGTTDFTQAWWGTNLARSTSPDGPWEKMEGTLLRNETPGMGKDGPELLVQDGKLYMYYRHGANATARVEVTGLGEDGQYMAMAHDSATVEEPERQIA